jgi:hypothetical protein
MANRSSAMVIDTGGALIGSRAAPVSFHYPRLKQKLTFILHWFFG